MTGRENISSLHLIIKFPLCWIPDRCKLHHQSFQTDRICHVPCFVRPLSFPSRCLFPIQHTVFPCLLLQTVWQPEAKLKKKEKQRNDRTVKGKKQWEKGSRKGLTVRENVRLIEASFAQLFLVAVRHCAERLGRWDPDVILRQGSPASNNPPKYQPYRRLGLLECPRSPTSWQNITSPPLKDNPALCFSPLIAGLSSAPERC